VSSIRQIFPRQNFEITNSPKFFPARILRYTVSGDLTDNGWDDVTNDCGTAPMWITKSLCVYK